MRIGIDIDDTITNTWEYLKPIYIQEFNIKIEENSLPYYNAIKDKVNITFDEFAQIMRKYDYLKKDIPIKEGVVSTLNKLKQEGHTIIFITARGKTYTKPYQMTKQYLDKYNIPYDKIIIESWNKAITCQEEKIDLFIDDSEKHCQEVIECGIETLMMETNYNKQNSNFKHVNSWYEVYEYIKNR